MQPPHEKGFTLLHASGVFHEDDVDPVFTNKILEVMQAQEQDKPTHRIDANYEAELEVADML